MKKMLSLLGLICLGTALSLNARAESFSHQSFDRVLAENVKDGVVDYPGIAKDARFAGYLKDIADFDPDQLPTVSARLAFWINAYNALAIQGILNGLSPETWIGKYRYFKRAKYRVGGRDIDLYALEHDVILPYGEPRAHFALVWASASCPKLATEAYIGEKLDMQLDRQAREFINDPTRNRFDPAQKTAHLSKIFDWFENEFKSEEGSVPAYVSQYVEDRELAQALKDGKWRVAYQNYDWGLNGRAPTGG